MKKLQSTNYFYVYMAVLILIAVGLGIYIFRGGSKQEQASTTYWEAVDISPIHTGKEPPTKWQIQIRNAENVVDLDSVIQKKVTELIQRYPDHRIEKMKITAEVEVVIKKE